MPQARSGGSSGSGGSRSSSGGSARRSRSTGSRSTGSRSTGSRSSSSRSGRATTSKGSTAKRSTTRRTTSTRPKPGTAEARVEAAANRVRKLNEQIIDAGKQAGDTTLASYEKFLKSIASSIERGPGKSDVEWISNLATAQAKFIRDLTTSLTAAARKRLK